MKRDKNILIRVSMEELEQIQENAGDETVSTYIRNLALKKSEAAPRVGTNEAKNPFGMCKKHGGYYKSCHC